MMNKASYRKGFLTADFLSQTYRISADASLRTGALVDLLNETMIAFMRIENIYVSPITNPAALSGNYTAGQIRKDTLSMAVITREEDVASRRPGQSSRGARGQINVFLTLPDFEVRGILYIESAVDVERFLMGGQDRFIPIYNATAIVTVNPSVTFSGGGILVNRELIGAFCVDKSS